MLLNVSLQFFSTMLARKAIWVVTIRQQQHLYVHALRQQHVGTSHGCFDTCLVAIIKQNDVISKPMQDVHLMCAKCRTGVCHNILHSALVHGYHIGIAFHHIHAVFLYNRLLCLIESIELTLLMVYIAIG